MSNFKKEDAIRFVSALEKTCRNDKEILACLRRYWSSPIAAIDLYRVICKMGFAHAVNNKRDLFCFAIVAACYGLHPHHDSKSGNFGATFRKSLKNQNDSADSRFSALLKNKREYLDKYLYGLMMMHKSSGTPLNYATLLIDLYYWSLSGGSILLQSKSTQFRWAKEFFSNMKDEKVESL